MSAATAVWRQFRFERRLFWRNPSAAFFNFLLPLILLLLVGTVSADDPEQLDVLVPGIAGMAVMSTTFTALAFNLTFLREQGILKRMRGTPLPMPVYFAGLLATAVVNAGVQIALIVIVGNLVYGVDLPRDPALLVGFSALGVVAFGALGIAFAHVIPNFDAAPAYVNAVFLPVVLVSGVFYSADGLPAPLRAVAETLPLKHVIDGLSAGVVAPPGAEDPLTAAAVVAAWGVAGLVLAVRGFRWE